MTCPLVLCCFGLSGYELSSLIWPPHLNSLMQSDLLVSQSLYHIYLDVRLKIPFSKLAPSL